MDGWSIMVSRAELNALSKRIDALAGWLKPEVQLPSFSQPQCAKTLCVFDMSFAFDGAWATEEVAGPCGQSIGRPGQR